MASESTQRKKKKRNRSKNSPSAEIEMASKKQKSVKDLLTNSIASPDCAHGEEKSKKVPKDMMPATPGEKLLLESEERKEKIPIVDESKLASAPLWAQDLIQTMNAL